MTEESLINFICLIIGCSNDYFNRNMHIASNIDGKILSVVCKRKLRTAFFMLAEDPDELRYYDLNCNWVTK